MFVKPRINWSKLFWGELFSSFYTKCVWSCTKNRYHISAIIVNLMIEKEYLSQLLYCIYYYYYNLCITVRDKGVNLSQFSAPYTREVGHLNILGGIVVFTLSQVAFLRHASMQHGGPCFHIWFNNYIPSGLQKLLIGAQGHLRPLFSGECLEIKGCQSHVSVHQMLWPW